MGKIIRNGINYGGTYEDATSVNYDGAASGLEARTVQEAVDEVQGNVDALNGSLGKFVLLGKITGNSSTEELFELNDSVNNYRLISYLGVYNGQILSQTILPIDLCMNRGVFLNYTDSSTFICRAGLYLKDSNIIKTSAQWLTFTEVIIYGIK